MHVKLVNGTDLLCFVDYLDDQCITISHPIEMLMDVNIGSYGKRWMVFSKNKLAVIDLFHVLFINEASESAIELYTEMTTSKPSDDDVMSDFEVPTTTMH